MQQIPEVRLGSVLFSLVTPQPGEEVAFNRWYERDHFFAGCMVGKNFFSGRRWVATRELRAMSGPQPDTSSELRSEPRKKALYDEYRHGSMMVLYWILDGGYEETLGWAVDQVNQLYRQDRMDPRRENVYSGFCDHIMSVPRKPDGVPVELALEYPYQGLFVAVVEKTPGLAAEAFLADCHTHLLPDWLEASGVSMLTCVKPKPLPDTAPKTVKQADSGELDNRYLWFGFLEETPSADAAAHWATLNESMRDRQLGELLFYAPFIPTIPGTDVYMDQL